MKVCSKFVGREILMSIIERVKGIIVNNLKIDPGKVTETASFKDDLGMDSLEQAELIMEFEKEFGCEIPESAAETIITVADAVKYLESVSGK
jgi:acyl carrier protein